MGSLSSAWAWPRAMLERSAAESRSGPNFIAEIGLFATCLQQQTTARRRFGFARLANSSRSATGLAAIQAWPRRPPPPLCELRRARLLNKVAPNRSDGGLLMTLTRPKPAQRFEFTGRPFYTRGL